VVGDKKKLVQKHRVKALNGDWNALKQKLRLSLPFLPLIVIVVVYFGCFQYSRGLIIGCAGTWVSSKDSISSTCRCQRCGLLMLLSPTSKCYICRYNC